MSFKDVFGAALNRNPEVTNTAEPSIDLLSKALFQEVVHDAKHDYMHRGMFQSMLEDDVYGLSPLDMFQGDPAGLPLPSASGFDATVVENLPERTTGSVMDEILGANPEQELGLDLLSNTQPSVQDVIRNMLKG